MDNTPKKIFVKKTVLIILIVMSPIIILILIFAWGYITHPIFDKFDQDRFIRLDKQMQNLFQEFKTASNGTDTWNYSSLCNADRTGWMATGSYSCTTSISTVTAVKTVLEVNQLRLKYQPLIDDSKILLKTTVSGTESSNNFGSDFVVSSIENHYTEAMSKIECDYLIKLYQADRNLGFSSDSYGTVIANGQGNLVISLRCSDTARDNWYPLNDSTDLDPSGTINN
jgi:hypothetical protein